MRYSHNPANSRSLEPLLSVKKRWRPFLEQKYGIILPAKPLKKHFSLGPEVCVGTLPFDLRSKQHLNSSTQSTVVICKYDHNLNCLEKAIHMLPRVPLKGWEKSLHTTANTPVSVFVLHLSFLTDAMETGQYCAATNHRHWPSVLVRNRQRASGKPTAAQSGFKKKKKKKPHSD